MSEDERADVAALRLGILARLADAVALAETLEQVAERGVAVLRQNDSDHAAVWLMDVLAPAYPQSPPLVLTDTPMVETGHPDAAEAHALAVVAVRSGRLETHPLPDSTSGLVELHAQPVTEPGQSSPSLALVVGSVRPLAADAGFGDYLELAAALLGAGYSGLRELAQARQQSETLRELDAAKSAFLANVSHELRTPLALISAPLDDVLLLPPEDVSTPAKDRLIQIRGQVVRLTRMVDAMLDFSRMEAGRITPNLVEVDVTALMRTLAASFGPAIERAGLTFSAELPDLPQRAVLDQDMLERIVLNLLSNALKYTAQGSVRLSLAPTPDGFEIAVSDTGIGIPVRDQERVFARFEQLPRHSRARSSEGAGIGLAMVRELSRLLGGDVDLRSAPARGSTFTVRLPYRTSLVQLAAEGSHSVTPRGTASFLADVAAWDAGEAAASTPAPGPGPGLEAGSGEGRPLLLVVEDSSDLSRYLTEVLSDQYEVVVAADGLEALAMARRRRPEAVLSDVMMPGLDGFGLVAEIRGDPHLRDLPVVLLSARAGLDASSEGLAQGADDYLVKPFDVTDLRARLASNIRRAADRSADASWRRAIMRSLNEPVLIADAEGLVTEFNDAFRRLVGWSMADGPFTPPYPWWPDQASDPEAYTAIAEATRGMFAGERMEGEYKLRHRSGRTVWASYSGSLVALPGKGRTAALKTLRDVTREHDARSRRLAAARISAEFASAESLDQIVGVAVDGLHALFDGDSTVQVAGPGVVQTFTASGPVEVDALPQAIADRLSSTGEEPEAPSGPVQGILLVPLTTSGATRAWVQFGEPRVVSADEQIVADMLARTLGLAVDRVLTVGELSDKQANLERAIESHRMIGQAVGVLVERHRITPAQAFQLLRTASQHRNVRLRELAERVLETGLDPDAA